ncbi:MAG: VOC family protein [Candidatus Babeliales bacterium]
MMKSSEVVLLVESVEDAVKFYAEKLAFDIVDLQESKEGGNTLTSARLRKGKCFVRLRLPHVEELAEFSFIKRCASRCTGLYVEMKKGIERFHERCQKKGVKIVTELKDQTEDGLKLFAIRDPYGIRITFAQPVESFKAPVPTALLGTTLKLTDPSGKPLKDNDVVDEMVNRLKDFGILRRSAKKYAKLYLKRVRGAK